MKNIWKSKKHNGELDILTCKVGKVLYSLELQSTYDNYDIWDVAIENNSNKIGEGFVVNMSYRVDHNAKDYESEVLKLGQERVANLIKVLIVP